MRKHAAVDLLHSLRDNTSLLDPCSCEMPLSLNPNATKGSFAAACVTAAYGEYEETGFRSGFRVQETNCKDKARTGTKVAHGRRRDDRLLVTSVVMCIVYNRLDCLGVQWESMMRGRGRGRGRGVLVLVLGSNPTQHPYHAYNIV
jgi:hypothetical protein